MVYLLVASFLAVGVGLSFADDGLRHLAFSNNSQVMGSWGEVYPMSLFGDYDLWGFWHSLLSNISSVTGYKNLHIMTKIINENKDQLKKYKNLIIIITVVLITNVFSRYINLRPDMLSGFYIMTIYLITKKIDSKKAFVAVFLASLLYAPMYYLFFVYMAAMSMYTMLIKDYRSTGALVVAIVAGFLYYYMSFGIESIEAVIYVLQDEKLRDGLMVSEGIPILNILLILNTKILFIIYLVAVLYFKVKHNVYLQSNKLFTFILSLSLLWVGQLRYTNLMEPVFYVFVISMLLNVKSGKIRDLLKRAFYLIILFKRSLNKNSRNISFIIAFAVLVGVMISNANMSAFKKSNEKSAMLIKELSKDVYKNKTILVGGLDNVSYFALYSNPTTKIIPSCSIGWESGSSRFHELYRKMLKERLDMIEIEELCEITNADYFFLIVPGRYEAPLDLRNNNSSLKLLKLFDKYLVFLKEN